MIEFKADCGHTVRAKDEDAGKAVRCSYCGRAATVPDQVDHGLDVLFGESELAEPSTPAGAGKPSAARRRTPWWRRRGAGRRLSFDPFGLVVRLCYFAALIIIVVVVARLAVLPAVREYRKGPEVQPVVASGGAPAAQPRRPAAPRTGLADLSGNGGLYVSCVPPTAKVFCLPVQGGDKTIRGRIDELPGCITTEANGVVPRATNGEFVLEVSVVWNDAAFSGYPQYLALRSGILNAPDDAERRRLVREYFVPDEATDVFVQETPDQKYLVRQYRGVVVRDGRWTSVRALYLPRVAVEGETIKRFAVGAVLPYLPAPQYTFDQEHVLRELLFYGVHATDQRPLLDALTRTGLMPYVTPDGRTQLFKIDVADGSLGVRDISRNN
ncbi:MAG TPA: hypothetical protein PKK06_10355 [Phycisphaerae bacterium]|nr:hypothetical protein [Phycisphaerae bacterium]HNU45764.1 hypothetical protein [Phycisphaerae bacterium]